jgi:site-specific recombinase XerD
MKDSELLQNYLTYLETIEVNVTSTLKFQTRTLNAWLKFLHKNNKILALASPGDLVDWLTIRRSKVSDATVQNDLCAIRKFHFYLYNFKFISSNPTKALPPMICNKPSEKSYLTVPESFQILNHISLESEIEFRNHIIISFLWSTGVRAFEFCNLTIDDFDFDNATVLIRKGKNTKQRQIFINNQLLQGLHGYVRTFKPASGTPFFFSLKGGSATPPAKKRQKFSTRYLTTLVSSLAKNAGLKKKVTALTFRHTFATHMFESEVPIDDIKEMLGHEVDTETCVYIHVSIDIARKSLNAHSANPLFKGYSK